MTCKAWDSCCCNGLPRLLRRREGQEGKERKLGKAGKEPDELTGVNTVNTSPEDSNESHTSGFLSRPEACPIEVPCLDYPAFGNLPPFLCSTASCAEPARNLSLSQQQQVCASRPVS